jgi:hypothetical protein
MIGQQLGRWVIDKRIGQGGMGNVYLAHETGAEGDGRKAAIKVLPASLLQQAGFVSRFEREIEALRQLRHDHIVQFFEAGEHEGQPYYVMEYIDGPTMADLLEDRGTLSWEDVVDAGIQVCQGLHHAHRQDVVHRDIKPANLLRTSDGIVKLSDFGVAKVIGDASTTAANALVGTADYASPEQAASKPVTKRSDLYSLGVVFYQLLTGRLPFMAETAVDMLHQHRYGRFDAPAKLVPEIPHEMDELVCTLLEKEPEKRPANAAEVEKTLRSLVNKMARRRQYTAEAGRGMARTGRGGRRVPRAEGKGPSDVSTDRTPWARAGVLVLLLAGVAAALVYVLRPPQVDDLLRTAEQQIAAGNWIGADDTLARLERRVPDHGRADRVNALRGQIAAAAGRRGMAAADAPEFTPPTCEAERFYRRGVLEYLSGHAERARETWRQVVTAFDGVVSQATWVALARTALQRTDAPASSHSANLDEALAKARTEKPEDAVRRLEMLKTLYGDQADPDAKDAQRKIDQALAEIKKNPAP